MEKKVAIRNVDELGRVVLPPEIRQKLDIQPEGRVQFIETDDGVLIRKYKPSCIFCGTEESLVMFNEKYICKKCSRSIHSLTE